MFAHDALPRKRYAYPRQKYTLLGIDPDPPASGLISRFVSCHVSDYLIHVCTALVRLGLLSSVPPAPGKSMCRPCVM
jgi:hypothetical protein